MSTKATSYVFSRLAEEMGRIEHDTGRKVLNFAMGSPDFPVSGKNLDALRTFVTNKQLYAYPGYGASTFFRDALIHWYANRFQCDVGSQMILPLPGAKYGITHLPLALFEKGDGIMIPNPGYPAYRDTLETSGTRPIFYDLQAASDFKPIVSELERKSSKGAKYIWLNFPSNPTGQILSIEELTAIVAFAKSRSINILYDNAYSEITFDGHNAPSIFNIPDAKDIAIEFGSFSKSYSLPGLRFGWVAGAPDLIQKLQDKFSYYDSGVSLLLQRFGAHILNNPDKDWHDKLLRHYEARRQAIADYLRTIGLTFSLPSGSLYIWAKIPDTYRDSDSFCEDMLHKKHILFTPGTAFGSNGERFVRVSIGVDVSKLQEYA